MSFPRTRTTSFSEPPRKTRVMLQRTESFLCLSDYHDDHERSSFLHMSPTPRRLARRAEFTVAPRAPKQSPRVPTAPVRTTSPLAPTRKLLPPRARFPRSKPEPDLYRAALKGRMRSSPEGEQILSLGPRLAISILSATRELERIVSAHEDDDVVMEDEPMRWVGMVVPCGA